MKKYLSFHLSFYDLERNYPGTILTNMTLNTVQMKKMFNDTLGTYIISFSIIITCFIVGCVYEYRLTLIAIGFLIFLLILNFIRKCAKPSDKKQHSRNVDEGTIISETLTNTKTIFAFNFQQKAKELYLKANDYIFKKQIMSEFIDGIIIGLTLFANFAKNAALFAATKKYVLNDTINSDDLTVVQALSGSGFRQISILSNIKGKIEFKHVYFAYPLNSERVALKDINMTIMPGEKVALVGYSGCGKSCLISLLNRFYDVEPDMGEILIDDINIKDYNLYELRKKIGFAQQEPSIFKTTVLENIRYGKIDATDDECIEAAKKTDSLYLLEKDKENETNEKHQRKKLEFWIKNLKMI